MLYYISGELVMTDQNFAVVDAGGIGYKLTVTGNTLGKLAAQSDKKVRLYTHMAVREDAIELYGFYTTEELYAFRLLISVSGVGAKSAVSILTLMTPERFALAVTTGDTKSIAKASGIGAKTAARIVLELKDKIAKEISGEGSDLIPPAEETSAGQGGKLSEALNAMLVLGYTRAEALYALKGISPEAELEDIIREALRKLMKT